MRACVCLRGDEGVMNKICLNQGEMYVNLGICNTSPARRTHAFICSMNPPPPLTHPSQFSLPKAHTRAHSIDISHMYCFSLLHCISCTTSLDLHSLLYCTASKGLLYLSLPASHLPQYSKHVVRGNHRLDLLGITY